MPLSRRMAYELRRASGSFSRGTHRNDSCEDSSSWHRINITGILHERSEVDEIRGLLLGTFLTHDDIGMGFDGTATPSNVGPRPHISRKSYVIPGLRDCFVIWCGTIIVRWKPGKYQGVSIVESFSLQRCRHPIGSITYKSAGYVAAASLQNASPRLRSSIRGITKPCCIISRSLMIFRFCRI